MSAVPTPNDVARELLRRWLVAHSEGIAFLEIVDKGDEVISAYLVQDDGLLVLARIDADGDGQVSEVLVDRVDEAAALERAIGRFRQSATSVDLSLPRGDREEGE